MNKLESHTQTQRTLPLLTLPTLHFYELFKNIRSGPFDRETNVLIFRQQIIKIKS